MNTTTTALQQAPQKGFPALLDRMKDQIANALPSHMNPKRMLRIVLTCYRMTPKLALCDEMSVLSAVVQAAQIGLEPGLMGQAYLVPYGRECQLIPGYRGLIDLVRRSGAITDIYANVVHAKDHFHYQTGLDLILEHTPYDGDDDPGPVTKVYAVAKFKDGGHHVEVMYRRDVEKIRDATMAWKKGHETPWRTFPEEMWRKTVLRRICKQLPQSAELAIALALDDAAVAGRQRVDFTDAIEGTWAPTPEVETDDAPQDDAAALRDRIRQKVKKPATPPTVQAHQTTVAAGTDREPGPSSPLPPVVLKEGETPFVAEFVNGEDD